MVHSVRKRSQVGAMTLVNGSIAAALLLASGCGGPTTDIDIISPRVVQISPSAPTVPVDAEFTITFSEPMYEESLNENTVLIIETTVFEADSGFESDFRNSPLTESNLNSTVISEMTVGADLTTVTLRPASSLRAVTRYSILLSEEARDAEGNPLSDAAGLAAMFRFDFVTEAGPPVVASQDVTSGGATLIAPNRSRFTVVFDQPVQGLSTETVVIRRAAGGGDVPAEALEIGPNRDRATLILAPTEDCEVLAPDETYVFAITTGPAGDSGKRMEADEFAFTTSSQCDLARHRVLDVPVALARETDAALTFETTRSSTTAVRFGLVDGPLDCLGGPCPVEGAAALDADVPGRFTHSVSVDGLTLGVEYAFTVLAQDVFGGVASATGQFATAPVPKVAVNEINADPDSNLDIPDAAGEFIEIVNYGPDVVDLGGFSLQIDDGNACVFPRDGSVVVQPGAFVVLVGNTWEPGAYDVGDDATVLNLSGAGNVCGSLVNSRASAVLLTGPDGRPVSSISAWSALSPSEGKSIERIAADGDDVVENFCDSRRDKGPTPGSTNGVTLNGCDT